MGAMCMFVVAVVVVVGMASVGDRGFVRRCWGGGDFG